MKALLLSLFIFTMSVTPSQFPVINQADLDGTETLWAQKAGVDYSLSLTNVKQYGGCDVYCTSLVIPTASVLTLNSAPLTIVAAPGAGYAIQVISAAFKGTYNSIDYATNTDLTLITDTATVEQFLLEDALFFQVSAIKLLAPLASSSATETQIIENKALKVSVNAGNPTAGNSDIKVYVQYRIINL